MTSGLIKFLKWFILLILVTLPFSYYRTKIVAYLQKPDEVISLLFSATGLASFGLQLLFVNVGIFTIAVSIDLFYFGWKRSAIRRLTVLRSPSAKGDLWCWILSVFSLYDFFALVFSFGLFYIVSSLIVKAGGFQIITLIPFAGLQFFLIFILSDLKQYLWHRFMHFKSFWELHKFHHSATEFNLITNSRGHFIEKGFLLIFDSLLFSLLGAPIQQFTFFLLLREFYNQILHSEFKSNFGWIGKYVLVSPMAHRLHHSDDKRFFDKNFGTFFIFWDKLFGTYASTDENITIGVKDYTFNKHGFWWDMWEGMKDFIFVLIGSKSELKK